MFAHLFADVLENVNPDLSDSEYIEKENPMDPTTPGFAGSDAGDAPTPGPDHGDADEGADGDEGEGEGDIDEELAAELDLALGDEEAEADDEEGDDDDDESDDDDEDDDDEDDEATQARKLLNEEIRDLEAAVAKKRQEIASSANPLIRVRCGVLSRLMRRANRDTAAALRGRAPQAPGGSRHEAGAARRDEGEAPPREGGRCRRRRLRGR